MTWGWAAACWRASSPATRTWSSVACVAPVAGQAAFDPVSADQLPGPARQVVLSPDGQWIALVSPGAAGATVPCTGASRAAALQLPASFDLAPGEALLGFVEP